MLITSGPGSESILGMGYSLLSFFIKLVLATSGGGIISKPGRAIIYHYYYFNQVQTHQFN